MMRQLTKIKATLIVLAGLGVILSGCAHFYTPTTQEFHALQIESKWPFEQSDLEPDPSIHYGRLSNGVRYVLMPNQTPRDRVSMHLFVHIGSLAETRSERGVAHFLEHMLFDGSTHFPPGEMVKYFQRIGMQFGPDANAHTGLSQTVYDIILPKGDADSLAEGLVVMQDYAQGALLLPDQVEKERKIVLAEKRSRDSASYRTFEETLSFEVDKTLPARRLPIGKEETINSFTPEMLRGFYDAWYRPERFFLVLAGEFDVKTAEQLIQDRFGKLTPHAKPRTFPDFEPFSHSGDKAFYHFERESGATTVSIERVEYHNQPTDSIEERRIWLLRKLADDILQKRLDVIVQSANGDLTSADTSSGYYLRQVRYGQISAETKPEKWRPALFTIEQELRKAIDYGFTPSELVRAKKVIQASLQNDVNEENTRESKDLAQMIMADLGQWHVTQSPMQRQRLLSPILDAIALEQVNDTFVHDWSVPHRLILVTGNAVVDADQKIAQAQILSAYHDSRRMEVHPPVDKVSAQFPYLPVPTPSGTISKKDQYSDLDIQYVEFANGLHLIFKKTPFKENEVLASLSFGRGESSEPSDAPALAELTQAMANESGFGRMDRIALENALSGRLASVSLHVQEDCFDIRGKSATAELELLFQLFQACIQDPGYRSEALQVVRKQMEQEYGSLKNRVEGVMRLQAGRFLAGGDSRFGWPTPQQMQQVTIERIKMWLGASLSQAPLELAVVGDFEPDKLIDLTARYLGSLPARQSVANPPVRSGPDFPEADQLHLAVATDIDKSVVAVVFPTDDFWDIARTRRLNILADIISERLRVRVREKLGAAYSPYAYNRAFRAYDGFGYLQAIFLIDPGMDATIVSETKQIAEELAHNGISEDELRRALDPTLTQIKDLRQSNAYWLNSVLSGSTQHPEQIDWARSIVNDYTAITRDEINALAKKYLDTQKASVIVIAPQQKGQQK